MDKLLENLIRDNILTEDQARVIRIEARLSAKSVRIVLAEAELLPVEILDRYEAGAIRMELAADEFVPDTEALELLGEDIARKYNVLPVTFDATDQLLVLASDDTSNLVVRDRLRREISELIDLEFRRTEAADIKRAIEKCYGACHSLSGILMELEQQLTSDHTSDDVDYSPVVRLLDAILQEAVTRRASDIHLSPDSLFVTVRYRVDGVLCVACHVHSCYWPALLVRIKVLSGVDIAETRLPQDGHMARTIHGQSIDFRVASFPIRGGENVVLRILDRRQAIRSLATLCDNEKTRQSLVEMTRQSSGLVLVCGPTGSGKTTTLYALLQSLDTSSLNVMTLEDPIEFPMPNIRQTRVHGTAAFGFADGVRGVLRQDPDVVLVGEIRDTDSCLMACRAAMTGHLVLSSTHADDCLGAISRLVELGASRSVLATVLTGIVSQRLLRKVCSHCQQADPACGVCGGLGYSGRIALFECLTMSEVLSALLQSGASSDQLREQANIDGLTTLAEQADELLRAGLTTAEEIERVLGIKSIAE